MKIQKDFSLLILALVFWGHFCLIRLSREEFSTHRFDKVLKLIGMNFKDRNLSEGLCKSQLLSLAFEGVPAVDYPPSINSDMGLRICPSLSQSCCSSEALIQELRIFQKVTKRLDRLKRLVAEINSKLKPEKKSLLIHMKDILENNKGCNNNNNDNREVFDLQKLVDSFYRDLSEFDMLLEKYISETNENFQYKVCGLCDPSLSEFLYFEKKGMTTRIKINYNKKSAMKEIQINLAFYKILNFLIHLRKISNIFACEVIEKTIKASELIDEKTLEIEIQRVNQCFAKINTQKDNNASDECYEETGVAYNEILSQQLFAYIYQTYFIAFEFLSEYYNFDKRVVYDLEIEDFSLNVEYFKPSNSTNVIDSSVILRSDFNKDKGFDMYKSKMFLEEDAIGVSKTDSIKTDCPASIIKMTFATFFVFFVTYK
jgi:hypothetical protein